MVLNRCFQVQVQVRQRRVDERTFECKKFEPFGTYTPRKQASPVTHNDNSAESSFPQTARTAASMTASQRKRRTVLGDHRMVRPPQSLFLLAATWTMAKFIIQRRTRHDRVSHSRSSRRLDVCKTPFSSDDHHNPLK